ncbi:MAG TPA: hypothetical protein VHJ78_02170 [Actinomycetota bacterium]|nr:hypothetical protein [Actinomycetota bacterium]
MDEEERRFQEWMLSKGPDGRPVWAPNGPSEATWRDRPIAQFIKGFLKSKGGLDPR